MHQRDARAEFNLAGASLTDAEREGISAILAGRDALRIVQPGLDGHELIAITPTSVHQEVLDDLPEHVDLILELDPADVAALRSGRTTAAALLSQGRVKVRGAVADLAGLSTVLASVARRVPVEP